jgi:ABC-type transport system substrate-binding protein
MLRRLLFIGLAAMFLAACAPTATPVPATATLAPATPTPVPTPVPHAQVIRFALVGPVNFSNAWAYFDKEGADYNNRAMQAGLWPRLYRLSPLSGDVEGYLADGPFSPFEVGADSFSATVSLRPGLRWSDGSPITAEDVAFTVNTALEFQLDLDWGDAYNPARLDRAEAVDSLTVRFHFMSQPSVADWQYGALQGPIVSAAFWRHGVESARVHFATRPALEKDLLNLKAEMAVLQKEMADLLTQLAVYEPSGKEYEKQQIAIQKKQEDINSVTTRTEKKQMELDAVMTAARQALHALDSSGEPTFGAFLGPQKNDEGYIRAVNPDFPFAPPAFLSIQYRLYPDEGAALSAVENGEAHLLLKLGGATPPSASIISSSMLHPADAIRYLAFNLSNPALADPNLRAAIACVIWQPEAAFLFPTDGLVPRSNHFWRNPDVTLPCRALTDASARLAQAVTMLESAGYRWDVKPAWEGAPVSGSGLTRSDGARIPALTVLGYESDSDPQRLAWASAVAESVRRLGIPVQFETVEQADVLYRVFDTGQFDMVILGWRLARYPAYLCDLFGAGNPYGYYSEEMLGQCETLRSTTDMETARQAIFAIQARLATDLPVVPLYGNVIYDPMRAVTYPFQNVLDGLSGLYGAPDLALPSAP